MTSRGARDTAEPLSTLSLVLGILSFVFLPVIGGVAAIVTGLRAKRSIDSSERAVSGWGRAVAGQVLGIANVATAAILVAIVAVMAIAVGNHVEYSHLHAGSCFSSVSSQFRASVDTVSCSTPHLTEVTGAFQAVDPGRFPGVGGIGSQAEPKCSALAVQYVGGRSTAGLKVTFLAPDQAVWDQGSHTIVCGLRNADGTKHRGSVLS